MKKSYKIFIILILLAVVFLFTHPSYAVVFGGLENARKAAGFGEQTDITATAGTIINVVLGFVGVLFLILLLYGGFIWMMARGNEQEIEKAKKIIEAAVIGVVVAFAAYAISYFVVQQFAPPSPAPTTGGPGGECTPITSCPLGSCGIIDDGCGGVIDCPSCPAGQICAPTHTCVAAPTEETANCNCCNGRSRAGQTMFACVSFCRTNGGVSSWGTTTRSCPDGGGEGMPPCTPTTCVAEGIQCGSISDGCGSSINCGSCPSGQTCSAGTCVATCTPRTACPPLACGAIDDGCGGTISCSCPNEVEYSCSANRCELIRALCTCCDGTSAPSVPLANCLVFCLPHDGTANWGSTSRACP